MILTGVLIYIPPELRAATAAMITVVSIVNLNYFIPHKNKTLFWLSQCSFLITCFKYLTALTISTAGIRTEHSLAFGYILVSFDILFMVLAFVSVVATVYIIRRKIKKLNQVKIRIKSKIFIFLTIMKNY